MSEEQKESGNGTNVTYPTFILWRMLHTFQDSAFYDNFGELTAVDTRNMKIVKLSRIAIGSMALINFKSTEYLITIAPIKQVEVSPLTADKLLNQNGLFTD